MSDDMIDYLNIALGLYIFISTYRAKRKLAYKVFWFIPCTIILLGAVSDLLRFDLGENGNLVFKYVLYSTLAWALLYTFLEVYFFKKFINRLKRGLKEQAKDKDV
ncbi:hypothetical protein [Pleionea sediminis]|uniref:hypothetical protein n=1 Tax=Pleionea sediminis TaxID=2569479 RepID=UPI001185F786|nr:hypothetical protein [Pleionea sediminis]